MMLQDNLLYVKYSQTCFKYKSIYISDYISRILGSFKKL